MIKIIHRVNTIKKLMDVPKDYGIEIDVRYHENALILHHDPFHHHESPHPNTFEDLLKHYDLDGPIIVNVKTEGIEQQCIALLTHYHIPNWFFLDLSMPYFVRYSDIASNGTISGFSTANLAVRYSEREAIGYASGFSGKAEWVWVDCFSKLALTPPVYNVLKSQFKICLVSPELQNHPLDWLERFKVALKDMPVDAVCTKRPDLW